MLQVFFATNRCILSEGGSPVFGDGFSNRPYSRLNGRVVADVKQVLAGLVPAAIKGRGFSPDGRSWRIDAAPRARRG